MSPTAKRPAASGADNVTPLRPPKPCPICGKSSQRAFHPFCSKRCADIDLNRWLSGRYVIPGDTSDEPDDLPDPTASHEDDAF